MQEQLQLPHNGTETSRAAAVNMGAKPEKVFNDRERCFNHAVKCGQRGFTDAEQQGALAMNGNTQRPRRGELAKAGRIVKDGRRRNGSAVWVVA